MATKLNGVVVYRAFVGDHYQWGVRVYRKGKIIFEAMSFYRNFSLALAIAKMVCASGATIEVRVGALSCRIAAGNDSLAPWMKEWLDDSLARESNLLRKRQARQMARFRRSMSRSGALIPLDDKTLLCRSNVSTRALKPAHVNPSDVINRKPNPEYL